MYFLFLRKTLNEIVKVNRIFQSKNADVTKITQDLFTMYRCLMQIVVEPSHLSNENLPNLKFLDHILPLEHVSYSYDFITVSNACVLNKDLVTYVKQRFKTFVIEFITQVQKRLPENADILLMMKRFHPRIAISPAKESIAPIGAKYRSTFEDIDGLANEWSAMGLTQWPQTCLVQAEDAGELRDEEEIIALEINFASIFVGIALEFSGYCCHFKVATMTDSSIDPRGERMYGYAYPDSCLLIRCFYRNAYLIPIPVI
ncbi:hypothetical protein SK128_009658 [Halocaridina rubra]|uniref:Uncharacterized protein n=1 Tax=Halocaridina rubra TaxID=373956 RepID=A0AAN8XML2_HALRR